ncbi:site-2 protease family protein [Actinopolymorpha sp. NPDC004070]|uniref:site-2 protease family protein n=1 Tax=Actinopolymorpha sp. NPDC004070 TaxID=3154548 RepID=UPI0033BF3AE0
MKPTFTLGRVAGISIGVHWSVLVMMLLVTEIVAVAILPVQAPIASTAVDWVAGVLAAVAFLASLLAHELAHAVVARRYGMPADRITLWLLGGVTELGTNPPSPRAAFLVAGAGPAASLVLGAVLGGLAAGAALLSLPTVLREVLTWLGFVNLVLGVFNLLPGAPLDGGRLLQAGLWKRSGDRARAGVSAARAGRFLGMTLIALGVFQLVAGQLVSGLWLALIGWFLVMSALSEESTTGLRERLTGVRLRDVMSPQPVTAPSWWTVDTFLERVAEHDHHRTFPVVDMEGRPVRLVTLTDLVRVPEQTRGTTRLADLGRPLRPDGTAGPEDLLTELPAGTWQLSGRGMLLVVEGGHVVGIVNTHDVNRAVELANLGHLPRPGDGSAGEQPNQAGHAGQSGRTGQGTSSPYVPEQRPGG